MFILLYVRLVNSYKKGFFIKFFLLIIYFWIEIFAREIPVPSEFIGKWVPIGASCKSENKLKVEEKTVTLINGSDTQKFGHLDVCFSCEGGAKYDGITVWLIPEFTDNNQSPFLIRFNTDEKQGIAEISKMGQEDLKMRFPIHNTKLYKCSP